MRKIIIATTLAICSITVPAFAGEDEGCTKATKEQWLTVDQLKTKLGEQGYTVDKIKIEDSCVETKVKDKDGKTAELYLDPATGIPAKKDD